MTEVWRLGDQVTGPVLLNINGHLLASTVLLLVVRLAQPQTKICGPNTRAIRKSLLRRVCDRPCPVRERLIRRSRSGVKRTTLIYTQRN